MESYSRVRREERFEPLAPLPNDGVFLHYAHGWADHKNSLAIDKPVHFCFCFLYWECQRLYFTELFIVDCEQLQIQDVYGIEHGGWPSGHAEGRP